MFRLVAEAVRYRRRKLVADYQHAPTPKAVADVLVANDQTPASLHQRPYLVVTEVQGVVTVVREGVLVVAVEKQVPVLSRGRRSALYFSVEQGLVGHVRDTEHVPMLVIVHRCESDGVVSDVDTTPNTRHLEHRSQQMKGGHLMTPW